MSCFFITGTDTNVGKTVASRAIMQALQEVGLPTVGYKPIAFNQDEEVYTDKPVLVDGDYDSFDNKDVLVLQDSSAMELDYTEVNSYTINHSVPVLTPEYSKISIEKMNQALAHLRENHESVLVEGAFGWLTPINPEYSFADWVAEHQLPVVLVVGIKEGCINHALLTAQAIEQRGLKLVGWIANRINPCMGYYAEVINTIQQKINVPLLAEIPYLYKPEKQELAKYMCYLQPLWELHKQIRIS